MAVDGASTLLTSVWEGNDAELIRVLIPFYWKGDGVPVIVDCTYGKGGFWRGSTYNVIKCDISPRTPDVWPVDYRTLWCFGDNSVDVIAFDPPHMSEKDTPNASDYAVERYGTTGKKDATDSYPEFLWSARRVLVDNGIIIAKLADQVHWHQQRFQAWKFVAGAYDAGLMPCDCIIKVRKNPGPQNWTSQHHARKRHSYFIIVRKGRCEI